MGDTSNLFQKFFFCMNADGTTKLPVTNGTYETDDMALDFQQGAFFVAFFDANEAIVTPSDGTVQIQFKPVETWDQWHPFVDASGNVMTINANTVGQQATYIVPQVCLPFQRGRMVLNGITGAVSCKAVFWKGITG